MQYFVRYYFDVVINTKDSVLLPNEEKEEKKTAPGNKSE